jgi:hypothetical protein
LPDPSFALPARFLEGDELGSSREAESCLPFVYRGNSPGAKAKRLISKRRSLLRNIPLSVCHILHRSSMSLLTKCDRGSSKLDALCIRFRCRTLATRAQNRTLALARDTENTGISRPSCVRRRATYHSYRTHTHSTGALDLSPVPICYTADTDTSHPKCVRRPVCCRTSCRRIHSIHGSMPTQARRTRTAGNYTHRSTYARAGVLHISCTRIHPIYVAPLRMLDIRNRTSPSRELQGSHLGPLASRPCSQVLCSYSHADAAGKSGGHSIGARI